MNSSSLVLAGVIGAAQLTGIGVLAAGYFSLNDISLLFFCFTVPLGAALGIAVAMALVSPHNPPDSESLGNAGVASTALGCLPSWMLAMLVSFGPLEVGMMLLAIIPLVVMGVFLRRWINTVATRRAQVIRALTVLIAVSICALPLRRSVWELYLSSGVYDAIQSGDASAVEKLLQRGANPNRDGAGGLMGGTPLMWATHKSDLKIMKMLLRGGADVNRKTHGGYTALMHARAPQAAQLLLDAGADPDLLNDAGYTAWHHARDNHWPKVAAVIKRAQTSTEQTKG
jgi:hypothetical protein